MEMVRPAPHIHPQKTSVLPAGGIEVSLLRRENQSPLSPRPHERDGNQNATHHHALLAGSSKQTSQFGRQRRFADRSSHETAALLFGGPCYRTSRTDHAGIPICHEPG
jgi:hypothetical protein